jgi:hypothetical protein
MSSGLVDADVIGKRITCVVCLYTYDLLFGLFRALTPSTLASVPKAERILLGVWFPPVLR